MSLNLPVHNREELQRLTNRYIDQLITAEELQRLNTLLRSNDQARDDFIEHLNLDSALGDAARALAGEQAAIADILSINAAGPKRFTWRVATLATCAAMILLAVVFAWPRDNRTYATVVRAIGIDSLRDGDPIGSKPTFIEQGTLELVTRLGARIVVEAPANFHFESTDRLNLELGRLTADVPETARGFTVITPSGEAIDLGTRFAIDIANAAESEVHVFEGEVIARARGSQHRQVMLANSAVRMRNDQDAETCEFRRGTFVSAREVTPLAEALRQGQRERADQAGHVLRQDPSLLVWLDFDTNQPRIKIQSPSVERSSEGSLTSDANRATREAVVHGARFVQGRFPGTGALDFVNSEDCVELDLQAEVEQFTLMSWLRANQSEGRRNSIYSTDEWGTLGQVHWMIGDNHRIRFAIKGESEVTPGNTNVWLETDVGTLSEFQRWVHLAIVYDSVAGQATQYLDGKIVAQGPMPKGLKARLGSAQLGNWKPLARFNEPRRRLSARLDEFAAFSRVLSSEELRDYHQATSPYR